MGHALHPCATTTQATRRRIRESGESVTALAARYGINRKTVQKWRRRASVEDAPRGRPRQRSSTVLSKEEEAIVVGFRRLSLLPLDDCLYALKDRIPGLTRSSLHRCLQRYGVRRLPRSATSVRARRSAGPAPLGCFHIELGETVTGDGNRLVFAATDVASRLFYAELYERTDPRAAVAFLEELIEILPYTIHTVSTPNVMPFSHCREKAVESAAATSPSAFAVACARNHVEHRLIAPDRIWGNVQTQRIAAVRYRNPLARYYYESSRQLADSLRAFVVDYNFGKRLKILRGRTPYQILCKTWVAHPEWFKRNPLHLPLAARQAAAHLFPASADLVRF